jgi:heme-degrading monooxygenase HmoA
VIARIWRGRVPTDKAAAYAGIVERTGMSAYRETPGNAGAQLLTRDLDNGVTEIVTLSWWESLDHIRAFTGADVESAKYYPEDDEYLIERDATASHYEVVPAS